LAAHDALRLDGVTTRVLNMHTLKPLDRQAVERAACDTGRIVTVEEHSIIGGLGSAVAEVLAELGRGRLVRAGVPDRFCTEVMPYPDLLRRCGLDVSGVTAAVRKALAD
jgi:transketolase